MSNLQYKPKSERPDLSKVCVYGGKQDDEFVGIRYENGLLRVFFPFGYSKPTNNDNEYRRDILNLISVLSRYSKESKDIDGNRRLNNEEVQFPIHAYIHVFNYFLNHGYYVERESSFKRASNGKINWAKTIKQIRPQISEGTPNKSMVYLDFITKKNNSNENEIISQIHKHCVYESYEKIGCLFGYFRPEKPQIPFNAKLFAAILKAKIAKTFNEKHILLFRNMLDIICYMDSKTDNHNASYGTYNFEYVWEGLIDDVFGVNKEEKRKYFPNCTWKIKDDETDADELDKKKTSLRPDTIMLSSSDKIFVLDAKYYQYGDDKRNVQKLPGTGSIIKQIAYAEFIESMRNTNDSISKGNIYNAFILPYAASKDKDGYAFECFGRATCDWKDTSVPYNNIYGILLDVRAIMQKHPPSSNEEIQNLAKIIEQMASIDSTN